MIDVHHRYATVDGRRLFYREAGTPGNPVIVLLHGFPTSSFMFRTLIPELADRYHVIAPDYLGFGYSDAPPVEEFDYTFDALADSVASLGLAVAFYYGITAYACVWYFRRTLFTSARNLFFRGIFPLLGALAMTWAFFQSAYDMIQPDYGYTAFGPLGGVFVLGVGMLVLGIPLMLACFAFGTKRFFRGETLNATTEVKVLDTY